MKTIRFTFAIILCCFISAHAQDPVSKISQKEIKMLIDSVSFSLNHYYIYPDKAALIEKTLRNNYKNGDYKKVRDQMELANTLQADIQKVHKDKHMRVFYAPQFAEQLLTKLPDSLVKKEEEMELKNMRSHNFYFVKTEVLPGNIGYLRWDGFVGPTMVAKPTFENAFQFVSNTNALIIDMRYNGGGSPETVNAMLNYFFDKKLPMNHIIDHKNDTVKHYTEPAATNFKLKMPVYVLTARRTFSGAEDFTYAMKYAKRATIIGDTTGGGAHPTGPCTLGQGFVLNIPFARSYHETTKTNWEGTGVYPDIVVTSELSLEKAQAMIFKECLAKAEEGEKKMLECELNVAENKLKLAELSNAGQIIFTREDLLKFCGEFISKPVPGASPYPLTMIVKGDHLYRHIAMPPDWKLIPVSNTRFVYDNDEYNRYMEFTFDNDGKVSGLTIYRYDGVYPYDRVK